jgi:hypothetical protein
MKAEHASWIRAFDYSAALSFGAGAALASWFVVPDAIPAPVAMVAGMLVGVVAAFPLLGIFSFVLGGFEILVMSAQIGMIAGMVGAMTDSASAVQVAGGGALCGFMIQAVLHLADRSLHGEVTSL